MRTGRGTRPPSRSRGFTTRWAELNNFHTVAVACEHADDDDLLILNSDIVFTGEVLESLSGAGGELTLAVDDSTVDEEAMGVAIVDGRAVDIGKHLTEREAAGEFIGASVLTPEARPRYLAESARALNEGMASMYYEDIYARISAHEPLGVARVSESWWAEIDVPADVERAGRVAAREDMRAESASPSRVGVNRWLRPDHGRRSVHEGCRPALELGLPRPGALERVELRLRRIRCGDGQRPGIRRFHDRLRGLRSVHRGQRWPCVDPSGGWLQRGPPDSFGPLRGRPWARRSPCLHRGRSVAWWPRTSLAR